MVGASGALMGVLVAFGMIYPESRLMLLFLPVPIKAKYFIPGIIILDIISLLRAIVFSPSNTATSFGGALTGFIMMWYWKKNQFNNHRELTMSTFNRLLIKFKALISLSKL